MKNPGPKLKRRSTRHVSEVSVIASKFGDSAKIIIPRLVWEKSDYIPPFRIYLKTSGKRER